jgi:hypothetical protein
MNVINFADFASKRQPATTSANVTSNILSSFTESYIANLVYHEVDLENPSIAFDIATIQFLMKGMAHRSQGESHPSQIILDTLKDRVVGVV